jgi:uncharacterized protein YqgV (UPF0045/DUF77 family)
MPEIQAEVSLYALGSEEYRGAIHAFWDALEAGGVDHMTGPMSTRVWGDAEALFGALGRAFAGAAADGRVVLILKAANTGADNE